MAALLPAILRSRSFDELLLLRAERLIERNEKSIWRLRTGQLEVAVDDEERNTFDPNMPSLLVRLSDRLQPAIAV